MRELAERFWEKATRGDGCWEWTSTISRLGYGRITIGKSRSRDAHRVAWELTYGPIPSGAHVLHRCDNRKCVRPDHLHIGSHAENMQEMKARGRRRGPGGVSHHFAKFTEDEVRALRERHASGESIASLARTRGVAFNTMWELIRRKTWAHVE